MAAVSISHLVIFIASLLIAGAVVGAAFTGVDHFNEAIEDRSITAAEQLRTDVSIISDPASSAIYNTSEGNVTLLIKNTGEMNLRADARQLDVLLDGKYVESSELDVAMADERWVDWRTGSVLELTIQADDLAPGDHRITVIVNGAESVIEFREEGT